MYWKQVWSDVKKHGLLSGAAVFFMTISCASVILTVLLGTSLLETVDGLMEAAVVPDLMQMHAGNVDESEIAAFAEGHPEIEDWQIGRFLNLDNSQVMLGDRSLADSTQDNGLAPQNERFDFLLGLDGGLPEVGVGQVYVPVCCRDMYGVAVGDVMTIGEESLVVAGFVRDAQMNAMMASSKRFLVCDKEYERLLPSGQEEYLIEFRTEDIGRTQNAYVEAGLPDNGPMITRPLILMINALSDGMMVFVVFVAALVIVAISLLCIHFILSIQMEGDRKEVGLLKALGIGKKDVRRMYFGKYAVFSAIGILCGCGLAWMLEGPLSWQMRRLYGAQVSGGSSMLWAFLAGAVVQLVLLLFIGHRFKRLDRLSALSALYESGRSGRWVRPLLMGGVCAGCAFLMIVPGSLYKTLSDSSFVSYMGIGCGEIRMDVRQQGDVEETVNQIQALLDQDGQVDRFAVYETGLVRTRLSDGSFVSLMAEKGNHQAFPVRYSSGHVPSEDNEIALSSLNAQELGLNVGDCLGDFVVCGIYSDITNGGKTAKLNAFSEGVPVIWSVVYVSLAPGTDVEEWMSAYEGLGADVVLVSDYVKETYGQTLSQLLMAFWVSAGAGVLIVLVVVGLFCRLRVEQNRRELSLRKALGLTSLDCQKMYFISGMVPVLAGVIIGLFWGIFGGERLCGAVLRSMGADEFRFVWSAGLLAGAGLAVLLAAGVAVWSGGLEIRKVKANECCQGRE